MLAIICVIINTIITVIIRAHSKELGISEKLEAEIGDHPEATFSGDPGSFLNARNYQGEVV